MKEILYQYNQRGVYEPLGDTRFGKETQLKLVIPPHEFSLTLGGETLRNTAFSGGCILVSREGEVIFYDIENNVIAHAEKGNKEFRQVRLDWKQGVLSVELGCMEEVDYYPNCDGEHDRWGTQWVKQRVVTLNLQNNSLEIQ